MTVIVALLLLLGSCLSGCASAGPTEPPQTTGLAGLDAASLPYPRHEGDVSLEQALSLRRSVRQFTDEELSTEELAQLLWAAQGVTRDWGARTAPSAGALYPLEVYVATPRAFLRYIPSEHQAQALVEDDLREEIWKASLRQDAIRHAPAVFVIAAVYRRTESKYGQRAIRYVHLEAGHAAQNILLQAVALDLGGVPIGAFDDQDLRSVLSLPQDRAPVYVIPVGHSAE